MIARIDARAFRALAVAVAGAVSCGDSSLPEIGEPRFDAFLPVGPRAGDALGDDEACPAQSPKVGEFCPIRFIEAEVCTYKVDECITGGGVFEVFSVYCCANGLWQLCGGHSLCDRYDALVPPDAGARDGAAVDAAARDGAGGDGMADAGARDGVVDAAASDAASDAAADTAGDTAADAAGVDIPAAGPEGGVDGAEGADAGAASDTGAAGDVEGDV